MEFCAEEPFHKNVKMKCDN